VVGFEDCDENDIKIAWSKLVAKASSAKQTSDAKDEEGEMQDIKIKNKIVFVTPVQAQALFSEGVVSTDETECYSMVLDKVNMHQAFDLDQDLIDLAKLPSFPKSKKLIFKMIFTTNVKEDQVR